MGIKRRTRRRAAARFKTAAERFDAFVASVGLRRMYAAEPTVIYFDAPLVRAD
jgi:hypothetical protein